MQFDMFRVEDLQKIMEEVSSLKKSNEKVRKGLFARNTSLEKRHMELEEKYLELERSFHRFKCDIYGNKPELIELIKEG